MKGFSRFNCGAVLGVVMLSAILFSSCGENSRENSSQKSTSDENMSDISKSAVSIAEDSVNDSPSGNTQADTTDVCKVWQVTMIMNADGDTHTLSDYSEQTGTDVSNWNIELTINPDGTSLVGVASQGSTQQGTWEFDGNTLAVANSDNSSEWLHYDKANKILEQDVSGDGSLLLIYTAQ